MHRRERTEIAEDVDVVRIVFGHPEFQAAWVRSQQQKLDRQERLFLYVALLQDIAVRAGMHETKQDADTLLELIEDAFSGVPRSTSPGWDSDGRMYPAQEDARRWLNNVFVSMYRHKAHWSFYGSNGALRIEPLMTGWLRVDHEGNPQINAVAGSPLIDREGNDGRRIEDLLAAGAGSHSGELEA